MQAGNKLRVITAAAICLPACAMLAFMLGATPVSAVAAVEQCRFIQAKAEREACYDRQAAELAAKRKPEPSGSTSTLDSLRQMRQEDDALYRSMHNICRGC
jgi:hypothetical protein